MLAETASAALGASEGGGEELGAIPILKGYYEDDLGGAEDETKVLIRIWLNERMAPTLLPYAGESVGNISDLISNQVRGPWSIWQNEH